MARPRNKSISVRHAWWPAMAVVSRMGGLSSGCSARVLCFLKVLLG
ncbi:hypothetical protein ES332_A11G175100v1 [Gossypium tomentosum]|uniref:Uncharacterized protein n=1 Tax=Gossypium tomentosum TaxID=34277 RepID=A0A5D2NAN3_GOSTO|nr:hypothetical protein ES332_A11G175100v1 [Gossypium tomentosum]